jgi:L-lactate dehydrogenase complex protein LldE
MTTTPSRGRPRVALLVTCLVDLFRPSVGFAAVKLLEDAGCTVEVPLQSCCGQPAYNSGDRKSALAVARTMLDAMEGYDHVVAPSGSCAGMVIKHYPELFAGTPEEARAVALAGRTHELTRFLDEVMGLKGLSARFAGKVTYHDSCSCLRESGTREQPRRLMAMVEGLELAEAADPEVCCGFGGTFAAKFPEISMAMVTDKADRLSETGAVTVLAADMGCLMNIAGLLKRRGSTIEVRHVAEVLAGMTQAPAIGDPEKA